MEFRLRPLGLMEFFAKQQSSGICISDTYLFIIIIMLYNSSILAIEDSQY